MRKVNVTQERVSKNLEFLNEVYKATNWNYVQLNQRDIIERYGISKKVFLTLQKLGWIHKRGDKKSSEYLWKVNEPNLKMSMLFIKHCSISDNINFIKSEEVKPVPISNSTSFENRPLKQRKVRNVKSVKTKEFSLLWGLIKINY